MNLRAKTAKFPDSPGVYLMKDAKGKILYIGKARSLRKRVTSYFKREARQRYQIKFLMEKVTDIDFLETKNEKEAILLEHKLIQEHKPKYNIDLKDNKTFVRIRLGMEHPFPSVSVTRKVKKDGAEYFGPYTSAAAARETVDQIARFFRIRTCKDIEFKNRSRPCIEYDIGRCEAPCVGFITRNSYGLQVKNAGLFLRGRKMDIIRQLRSEMKALASGMKFEDAAKSRNLIAGIKKTLERQNVISDDFHYALIGDALKKKLHLKSSPLIIECVDISNIQGKYASGSIVCFMGGKPEKSRYRLFNITRQERPNDYAMMHEVLERRLCHAEWGMPDLLMVDGGRGQLSTALKVLANLEIRSLPVAAIAKPDHVYIPNRINPISFKSYDPALLYLSRIRDEAHRFGICHYRRRHIKYMTTF